MDICVFLVGRRVVSMSLMSLTVLLASFLASDRLAWNARFVLIFWTVKDPDATFWTFWTESRADVLQTGNTFWRVTDLFILQRAGVCASASIFSICASI